MNMRSLKSTTLAINIALLCVPQVQAEPLRQSVRATQIVDLSHTLHDEMPVWPGDEPFRKIRVADYENGYRLHKFSMAENNGTHLDAPSHFAKGKHAIDQIPISDLLVPAVVIDIQSKVEKQPDYQLTVEDVRSWESRYGTISNGSLVILSTGWSKRFNNPERYINMDAKQVMHFPGYSKESAAFLVQRGVVGIGIDTLSLDYGPSQDFAVHVLVLGANRYMVENLANVDVLPPTGAIIVLGVLSVRDGSQAPARVFALLP